MKIPQPIFVQDLMFKIDDLLIELLESLSINDWQKPTIVKNWKVKDIAVHLLDGNLRSLSMLRDSFFGEKAENINSYQDLVHFLNQLNAEWIKATKRLSPTVILELLRGSGKEYCTFLSTLDPFEPALFSVAWAGEKESKNWFHVARKYTEKWHHQQQIRLAVNANEELLRDEYYLPYLDTSVRALPFHYRNTRGKEGDAIKFVFRGASDKIWYLKYIQDWKLFTEIEGKANCEVVIQDEWAWRIFTKGIKKEDAIKHSEIIGNKVLGEKIFEMLAVMA